MEIKGFPTEALTDTGLKLFEPSKRNGLRILQEEGTRGGDDTEKEAEAAMETKRLWKDLVARKEGRNIQGQYLLSLN